MAKFALAQIVADACAIAKVPGWLSQGGRCFNLVLDDLVLHRDLKVNRITTTLTVQAGTIGPFNLPSDYLRTYDLFYLIPTIAGSAGLPILLSPVSPENFDREIKDPSLANYPTEYATDLSPKASGGVGLIYVYPMSSGLITMTHRYMVERPFYASPETDVNTIPWFEDQDYLIHATATRLMKISDDQRYDTFRTDGENMLRTHVIMEGDEQKIVKEVRLDPRRFHPRMSQRPTKVTD